MTTLKILTSFKRRLCSDLHPIYRWKKQLEDSGILVHTYYDHRDKGLKNTDTLLIYNRDFKNQFTDTKQLITALIELKKEVKKLIWFDSADSSGSMDFEVIPFVDVFLKKQVLKDLEYYTGENGNTQVRIWLDPKAEQKQLIPCPIDMTHKIKTGWNLSYYDYRPYDARIKQIVSNSLSYKLYPTKFYQATQPRPLDLTYRGTLKSNNLISFQRNKVIGMLNELHLNIAHGSIVSQKEYLKELTKSKVSISPFGWGEICYRDFETFICGSILIKPSMEHVNTFPNIFVKNQTYIPVQWDLSDLEEKIVEVISNHESYTHIAVSGQEAYKRVISDPDGFIKHLKGIME
ncbi:glycosyltransferase family 1 protein [Flavihumibacter sp. R14]|nr:glycosyltransferase family 1 protein [Flavihumibacter soli]